MHDEATEKTSRKAKIWVCRSGVNGIFEEFFLSNSVAGFAIGKTINYKPDDDYKALYRNLLPYFDEEKKPSLTISRIFTIANKVSVGDIVLMPRHNAKKQYSVGIITGSCVYEPSGVLSFYRKVSWRNTIDKASLDKPTCNSLGSLLTLFEVHCSNSSYDLIVKSVGNI